MNSQPQVDRNKSGFKRTCTVFSLTNQNISHPTKRKIRRDGRKEKQQDRGGLGVTGNRKIEPMESYHVGIMGLLYCSITVLVLY